MIKCGICKKLTSEKNYIVRASWALAGGRGNAPSSAIVHVSCDVLEQDQLRTGMVKMDDIWSKIQPIVKGGGDDKK